MKKRSLWCSFLLVSLLVLGGLGTGCSADRLEEVDSAQAGTISSALTGVATQVQAQAALEFKNARPSGNASQVPMAGGWFTGTLEQFTVQGELKQGSGGGSISVSGQGGLNNKSLAISLSITLNDWTSGDLVLSGTITLTFSFSLSGSLSTQAVVSGLVHVKGLVDSHPELALPATVDLKVETQNLQVKVCGSVAHHTVGQGSCE